jgi:hypothetical protein
LSGWKDLKAAWTTSTIAARGARRIRAFLIAAVAAYSPVRAAAEDGAPATDNGLATLCGIVETAARKEGLPVNFFTRLIWRESAFHSSATSPAGAQGVAQFMPAAASDRGLVDPFDPAAAIPASAKLLAELAERFGNLGLAAAAYNAGQGRVAKWLQGQSELPAETRQYVFAVTGRQLEDWRRRRLDTAAATHEPCIAVTEELARLAPVRTAAVKAPAWVARLDGTLASAIDLLDSVPKPRPVVRSASQASVDALCASIRALGASCQVFARQ